MSGVAGGDRISNEHVNSTAKSYIDSVLSGFPGFVSAEVTGGVAAGKKDHGDIDLIVHIEGCLLYTSPSPRDRQKSRMPSSA